MTLTFPPSDRAKGKCKYANGMTIADFLFGGNLNVALLQRGLGGQVVIHSAASAQGPGFNSPVGRAYLRFNSRASTLAGRQCLAMRCTVARNCDRIMQCS